VLYKCPDYTAYEDYLAYHRARLTLVPAMTREENGFSLTSRELEAAIVRQGVTAYVFSNPCNPTGDVVIGDELGRHVALVREHRCLLGCDEFYSHFMYDKELSYKDVYECARLAATPNGMAVPVPCIVMPFGVFLAVNHIPA